jgi:hypothetical protein
VTAILKVTFALFDTLSNRVQLLFVNSGHHPSALPTQSTVKVSLSLRATGWRQLVGASYGYLCDEKPSLAGVARRDLSNNLKETLRTSSTGNLLKHTGAPFTVELPCTPSASPDAVSTILFLRNC